MRGWLVAAALALAGCPGGQAEVKPSVAFRADAPPSLYFPLAEGTAWSYDVADELTGDKLLLVNRVEKREGGVATFGGTDPLSYEDRGDAILRRPSGAIVLRGPLAVGESWDVPNGHARITAVDAVVETAAGPQRPCVAVEETSDDRRVVTWFAPNVGPVKIEIYARGPAGERLAQRGILRSYHAAGAPSP